MTRDFEVNGHTPSDVRQTIGRGWNDVQRHWTTSGPLKTHLPALRRRRRRPEYGDYTWQRVARDVEGQSDITVGDAHVTAHVIRDVVSRRHGKADAETTAGIKPRDLTFCASDVNVVHQFRRLC